METAIAGNTKQMVFKEIQRGTSKKSGKPYSMCVLHDPVTLENVNFFLDGTEQIPADLKLHDKITVAFGMGVIFGQMRPVLQSIKKN